MATSAFYFITAAQAELCAAELRQQSGIDSISNVKPITFGGKDVVLRPSVDHVGAARNGNIHLQAVAVQEATHFSFSITHKAPLDEGILELIQTGGGREVA